MISPQLCHFDFPHVSAEPFICIYMNRFNSPGCRRELKPLENPIFRKKQHWKQENSDTAGSVLVLLRTENACSSRNSPNSFLGGSTVALLMQSQQKCVSLTDFLQRRRCCRLAFLLLGSVSCWGWLLSSSPVACSARRRLKEGCVEEEEEGACGIAWLFLPICAAAFGFAAALVGSRTAGEWTNAAIS